MKPHHGLVLGLLLISCLGGRVWAVETASSATPEAKLWRLAEQAQAEEEQRLVLVHASPLHDFLDGVLIRLWTQAHTSLPPMTVKVIQDSKLMAYTYPNGVCYISSGMLSRIQSEDQLAMILGHEMVHYLQRHTLKAAGRYAMPFVHSSNASTLSETAAEAGQSASVGRFVQTAEQQADREGLALMRQAGYCPDQVLVLLANFNALPGSVKEHSFARLAARRRVQRIRQMLENQPASINCPDATRAQQDYRWHIAPALMADASAALQRGMWEQALDSISQYLTVEPQDPKAHFILGQIQSHRSIPDALHQAMAAYQEAIRLNRHYSAPYGALGIIHFKAGRKTMARQYFETFLALTPQASESAYIRGYLQLCHE